MKIETLKDLEATLKVCRKFGVTSIAIDGINMLIGDVPEKQVSNGASESTKPEETLSEEDILFWSASAGS
jgi:Zn-dependent peptidase ImmA (M78 family)